MTRGYFIAAIIDDLSDVSARIKLNNDLGFTDKNRHVEDFFMMVLNRVLKLKLENLNRDNINYPALDLGDRSAGVAFQVTASADSGKINHTLEKITDADAKAFSTKNVLVTGRRQGTYSGLNATLCAKHEFSIENIWDMTEICKHALDLTVEELRDLQTDVRSEVQRVFIELERRLPNGDYPTNLIDSVDPLLRPQIGDLLKIKAHVSSSGYMDAEDFHRHFDLLACRLARLPRLTRELLGIIIDRREPHNDGSAPDCTKPADYMEINIARLAGLVNHPDFDRFLQLLLADDYLERRSPDDVKEKDRWRVRLGDPVFTYVFYNFIRETEVGVRKSFSSLDFTDF